MHLIRVRKEVAFRASPPTAAAVLAFVSVGLLDQIVTLAASPTFGRCVGLQFREELEKSIIRDGFIAMASMMSLRVQSYFILKYPQGVA
jgi:hypothetical protein